MRWGDRSLEAEVLDGKSRTALALGDTPEDDFVIGSGAAVRIQWFESKLEVRFSLGIGGTASLKGDAPTPLGQLLERGLMKEGPEGFTVTLMAGDSLALKVGAQTIDIKQVRGRISRVRIDVLATLALVACLTLLALWVGSTVMQMEPLDLLPRDSTKR
jgi:hypothetical protein